MPLGDDHPEHAQRILLPSRCLRSEQVPRHSRRFWGIPFEIRNNRCFDIGGRIFSFLLHDRRFFMLHVHFLDHGGTLFADLSCKCVHVEGVFAIGDY